MVFIDLERSVCQLYPSVRISVMIKAVSMIDAFMVLERRCCLNIRFGL